MISEVLFYTIVFLSKFKHNSIKPVLTLHDDWHCPDQTSMNETTQHSNTANEPTQQAMNPHKSAGGTGSYIKSKTGVVCYF